MQTDAFDREKANFSGIASNYQNNYWVKKYYIRQALMQQNVTQKPPLPQWYQELMGVLCLELEKEQ